MTTQAPLSVLGYDKEQEEGTLNELRGKTQTNTRKISDLLVQFEEARIRIDKLLSRKSRSRSDFNDLSSFVPAPRRNRSEDTSYVSDTSRTTTTTKVQIMMSPRKDSSFKPVTLTVNVHSDEEE